MDFSKAFKQIWWLILIGAIGIFLHDRYSFLTEGKAVPADIVVFLTWIALCIAPLFKEIELPGIKLKQEIEKLKNEVKDDISAFRNEISNTVEIKSNISPNFLLNIPPPDSQLPSIETRIEKTIKGVLTVYGIQPTTQALSENEISVSEGILFLLKVRYNLEKEFRDLAFSLGDSTSKRRSTPLSRVIWNLVKQETLPSDVADATRQIYSVCSAAMHGENVSESQIQFVRRTAPELIAALRAISLQNA